MYWSFPRASFWFYQFSLFFCFQSHRFLLLSLVFPFFCLLCNWLVLFPVGKKKKTRKRNRFLILNCSYFKYKYLKPCFPESSVGEESVETPVRFLGWEDPLEMGQAPHSDTLGLPLWLSWWRIRLQCGRPINVSPNTALVVPHTFPCLDYTSRNLITFSMLRYWSSSYGPAHGLSRWLFHVHLERKNSLLFWGESSWATKIKLNEKAALISQILTDFSVSFFLWLQRELQLPTLIMDLSVSLVNPISFCFAYFKVLLLVSHTFRIMSFDSLTSYLHVMSLFIPDNSTVPRSTLVDTGSINLCMIQLL